MKTLVTYESKTGFTRKYATWIAQALSCKCRELSKLSLKEVAEYEQIIHGGWVMAGMIKGADKVKSLRPKKLIVFGVGLTPVQAMDITKFAEANKLGDTPVFYFEGGTDPKNMGFLGRTVVKMVTKKPLTYVDNTNCDAIDQLVKLAQSM